MNEELCANDWAVVHQMVSDFIEDMATAGMPEDYKVLAYRLEVEKKLEAARIAEQEAKALDELWEAK